VYGIKVGRNFWMSVLVSISSTFYEQLLRAGAQKRKKDSQVISLFTLLGSTCTKAARKHVGEIDPW